MTQTTAWADTADPFWSNPADQLQARLLAQLHTDACSGLREACGATAELAKRWFYRHRARVLGPEMMTLEAASSR